MLNPWRASLRRALMTISALGMAACGPFPEPSTEQPRLSAWVAERYQAKLKAAEIVKINSYSDRSEKPIYVELRDNTPVYFPYRKDKMLVVFVVEMRDGRPIVKHDRFTEAGLAQMTETMAWVIEDAISRAETHNRARDIQRSGG